MELNQGGALLLWALNENGRDLGPGVGLLSTPSELVGKSDVTEGCILVGSYSWKENPVVTRLGDLRLETTMLDWQLGSQVLKYAVDGNRSVLPYLAWTDDGQTLARLENRSITMNHSINGAKFSGQRCGHAIMQRSCDQRCEIHIAN
eukprot:scaffold166030_cov32-Prasinocladus_malaysianus.AAC.4